MEETNRGMLVGRETVLGADHPDLLTSVYCLVHVLDELQVVMPHYAVVFLNKLTNVYKWVDQRI